MMKQQELLLKGLNDKMVGSDISMINNVTSVISSTAFL